MKEKNNTFYRCERFQRNNNPITWYKQWLKHSLQKDEINMADERLSPLLKNQQREKSSESAFCNLQTELVTQRKGIVEDAQFYSVVSRDG